jgi:hypothetical protein
MREPTKLIEFSAKIFAVVLLAASFAATAFAQSIEADSPTPITASEVSGKIAARDVGDARLTRYFYILSVAPGDLLVTVESSNLNGDVDLFTAGTLRPLAKVSMYASESETKATKSIFLKQRQQIVLRVEARSANDNDGVYRIRFEGSFEALPNSALASGTTPATPRAPEVSSTRSSGTKRVSAAGARLPEEVKETVAESKAAQPQPSPSPTVAETTATTTTPEPVTTARRTPRVPRKSTRTPPPANTASAQPVRNRTPRVRSANKPTPASSATAATARAAKPSPQPTTERTASAAIAASPRLVIEFRSGAKTERSMSSVRRVTIDNNQLVIVNRDGKIERQQLADVLRFSIEP